MCGFSDPHSNVYRFTVLAIVCGLTFGSYFCFDMPSVLQGVIEDDIIRPWAKNQTGTYYNLFYLVYAWTNMVFSLFSGVLVDRWGLHKSMFLYITFCLLGSSLYAVAPVLPVTSLAQYILMLGGRIVFGVGNGSVTVVQNAIVAKWFKDKHLAMACGITLSVSRLGSVLNFNATNALYNALEAFAPGYGLSLTLFVGCALVLLSLVLAYAYKKLDDRADAYLRFERRFDDETLTNNPKKKRSIRLQDVKNFPGAYWIICLLIMLFYNMIFPFMADATDFIQKTWPQYTSTAGNRVSIVYTVSMVVSPFLGAGVDYFGRRSYLALFGVCLTVPVFYFFANATHESMDPIYALLALGVAYSTCAAALWPSIQYIIELKSIGTANGIATSIQFLGVGTCNFVVGALNPKSNLAGYHSVMIFFMYMGVSCIVVALVLIVADWKPRLLHYGKRDFRGKQNQEFPAAVGAGSVNDSDLIAGLLDDGASF
jgi:MFS family permease